MARFARGTAIATTLAFLTRARRYGSFDPR
jgi:hypothetical protein